MGVEDEASCKATESVCSEMRIDKRRRRKAGMQRVSQVSIGATLQANKDIDTTKQMSKTLTPQGCKVSQHLPPCFLQGSSEGVLQEKGEISTCCQL